MHSAIHFAISSATPVWICETEGLNLFFNTPTIMELPSLHTRSDFTCFICYKIPHISAVDFENW